jgi:hypothetical protein
MSGIITTYFKVKNNMTLKETIDKSMIGFDELLCREYDNTISAKYYSMLSNSNIYDYLKIILNNLEIYSLAEMEATDNISKVFVEISARVSNVELNEKLIIVSLYDAVSDTVLSSKVDTIQSIDNIYNNQLSVKTATETFLYDPLVKLNADLVVGLDTSDSMPEHLAKLKDSLKGTFIRQMNLYNCDWRVYVICSSTDYDDHQILDPSSDYTLLTTLLSQYDTVSTPGEKTNIISNLQYFLEEREIPMRNGVPMHALMISDSYQLTNTDMAANMDDYHVGMELPSGVQNSFMWEDLDRTIDFFFEKNNITFNAISPLDKRTNNLTTKMVKDTNGYYANIDDVNAYYTMMDEITKRLSAKSSTIKLTNDGVIASSVNVSDSFGYSIPTESWRFDPTENSVVLFPGETGVPVASEHLKVTYDYV